MPLKAIYIKANFCWLFVFRINILDCIFSLQSTFLLKCFAVVCINGLESLSTFLKCAFWKDSISSNKHSEHSLVYQSCLFSFPYLRTSYHNRQYVWASYTYFLRWSWQLFSVEMGLMFISVFTGRFIEGVGRGGGGALSQMGCGIEKRSAEFKVIFVSRRVRISKLTSFVAVKCHYWKMLFTSVLQAFY